MQYRDNALLTDYRVFSVKFSVFHCRTTSSTQKKSWKKILQGKREPCGKQYRITKMEVDYSLNQI